MDGSVEPPIRWALGVYMIKNSCIKIETNKFPILEGEKEEICNDDMYGKALCQYLGKKLSEVGITSLGFFNEDWGWYHGVEHADFSTALCIYSPDFDLPGNPVGYVIMPFIQKEKIWSWSKFRKIDVSNDVLVIMDKVADLFEKDNEIVKVSRHDEWPY